MPDSSGKCDGVPASQPKLIITPNYTRKNGESLPLVNQPQSLVETKREDCVRFRHSYLSRNDSKVGTRQNTLMSCRTARKVHWRSGISTEAHRSLRTIRERPNE